MTKGLAMQFLAELIGEWLLELPDFEPEKQAPFGSRYWLGWLGILFHLVLVGLLAFISFFSLAKLLKDFHLGHMILATFLLGLALFSLWRLGKYLVRMCRATNYYWKRK
ncbi:hypothetical protein ACHBGV_09555 [Streptococcus sp. A34]|uniref:Uncharacterized protein n=1 Tax=Streptococcus suis TaxID=1307 RepID=A0A3R8SKT7_STRSU|nr:hypothetical protein [Streptococcus suis]NQL62193.1 hypothetical protein [Streptococcus suis]NQP19384.1 hypothetical protein [Streptococcus suis]RRR55523.1 hypothetical protein EI998_00395 [Streptococcus suis]UUM57631.1 hypothetical protein NQZ91_09905 [Streptococcus suis]